ncbi:MAG TPA: preprotein translocase subunit SecE [Campylobacterales bacterium]|nr:preprotein translocase subunit SecE [Campylobacterales bacterium]
MEKLTTYFAHVKEEIQKVIFPTKVQVRQAFVAVFIVVSVISIFLALVDMFMSAVVSSLVGS